MISMEQPSWCVTIPLNRTHGRIACPFHNPPYFSEAGPALSDRPRKMARCPIGAYTVTFRDHHGLRQEAHVDAAPAFETAASALNFWNRAASRQGSRQTGGARSGGGSACSIDRERDAERVTRLAADHAIFNGAEHP